MPKYKVADDARIEHDGKLYEGGKDITLTDEQAVSLLALGRLIEASAKPAKKADSEAPGA
jgi:hypothetical protein